MAGDLLSIGLETDQMREAREKGICPRCKDGNGKVWDGAGSRTNCDACRGDGTWATYRLEREFVKGWNAALKKVDELTMHTRMDTP